MSIKFSGGEEQFNRKMRQIEWEGVEEYIRRGIGLYPTEGTPVEIVIGKDIPRPGATSGRIDGIPWSVSEKQPADQIRIEYRRAGDERQEHLTFPWVPTSPSHEQQIRTAASAFSESLKSSLGPGVNVEVDVSLD